MQSNKGIHGAHSLGCKTVLISNEKAGLDILFILTRRPCPRMNFLKFLLQKLRKKFFELKIYYRIRKIRFSIIILTNAGVALNIFGQKLIF